MVYVQFDQTYTVDQVITHLDRNTDVQRILCTELLDDASFQTILDFLHSNYHRFNLRALLLPKNMLTPLATFKLAQVLQSQTLTLQELDLSNNSSALKKDGLQNLVQALSSPEVQLQRLNLSRNDICTPKTKDRVSALRQLWSGATRIVELDLSHNKIGRKITTFCDGLQTNTTIRRLDLSANDLKDKVGNVCNALDKCCALQELNLSSNYITAAGAKHVNTYLRLNPHLVVLDMSLNYIYAEGAEAMYEAICYNYVLRKLNLSRNTLRSGGTAIVEALLKSEHTVLESIDLSWNELTDETAIVLAQVLETKSILVNLNLAVNNIGDPGINALAGALHADVSLKELDIRGNQMRDPSQLIQLVRHGDYTLDTLHYKMKNLVPDQEALLEAAFTFRENRKTWLGNMLQRIEAYKPGHFDRVSLNFRSKDFGDEEVFLLAEALYRHRPPVPSIEIPKTSRVTSKGVTRIAHLCLQEIHVERFYVYGCTGLASSSVKSIGKSLRAVRCPLECLTLSECSLGPELAAEFAADLRLNTSLKKLNLSFNELGSKGAKDVLAAALDHSRLEFLNLSGNAIGDDALTGLPNILRLRQLLLHENEITDAGALDLAKSVMHNTSIIWLRLCGNPLTSKGIQALRLFLRNDYILEFSQECSMGGGPGMRFR